MTRDTSSRTSQREFAWWDRDSSFWRTSEDTLLSDSTPFSGRWPISGMTRDGLAYQLPKWEPPIDASGSSSSPLLGTPSARDWRDGAYCENVPTNGLLGRQVWLFPTPTTSDTNGPGAHGDGGKDLRTTVTLLPTPAVNDMGAGKTVEDWDAWTARMKAAHGNGNGHGKSLSIEAQRLLPTPTAETRERSPETAAAKASGRDFYDLSSWVQTMHSTGDSTPKPSTDGPQSWDVPLPLQLSPEPKDNHDSAPDSSNS